MRPDPLGGFAAMAGILCWRALIRPVGDIAAIAVGVALFTLLMGARHLFLRSRQRK